ncbi:hypothetical protein RZS08_58960, partial [Arthrospira platensis SPKY1]|nr:hypothetical protein [Arthrospira platensis SPKY1]
ALFFWLVDGDTNNTFAFLTMASEQPGDDEYWQTLFKNNVETESGPYQTLFQSSATTIDPVTLELLNLPSGEWISLTYLMYRHITTLEVGERALAAFDFVDKLRPADEAEALAPFLYLLATKQQ